MSELLATLIANVVHLAAVAELVDAQVGAACVLLAALFTFKRFLSRVCEHVPLQYGFTPDAATAYFTLDGNGFTRDLPLFFLR